MSEDVYVCGRRQAQLCLSVRFFTVLACIPLGMRLFTVGLGASPTLTSGLLNAAAPNYSYTRKFSLVQLAKLLALFLFAFPTTVLLPGYLLPVAPNYSCTTLATRTRTATEPNNLTRSSIQTTQH